MLINGECIEMKISGISRKTALVFNLNLLSSRRFINIYSFTNVIIHFLFFLNSDSWVNLPCLFIHELQVVCQFVVTSPLSLRPIST